MSIYLLLIFDETQQTISLREIKEVFFVDKMIYLKINIEKVKE